MSYTNGNFIDVLQKISNFKTLPPIGGKPGLPVVKKNAYIAFEVNKMHRIVRSVTDYNAECFKRLIHLSY